MLSYLELVNYAEPVDGLLGRAGGLVGDRDQRVEGGCMLTVIPGSSVAGAGISDRHDVS